MLKKKIKKKGPEWRINKKPQGCAPAPSSNEDRSEEGVTLFGWPRLRWEVGTKTERGQQKSNQASRKVFLGKEEDSYW